MLSTTYRFHMRVMIWRAHLYPRPIRAERYCALSCLFVWPSVRTDIITTLIAHGMKQILFILHADVDLSGIMNSLDFKVSRSTFDDPEVLWNLMHTLVGFGDPLMLPVYNPKYVMDPIHWGQTLASVGAKTLLTMVSLWLIISGFYGALGFAIQTGWCFEIWFITALWPTIFHRRDSHLVHILAIFVTWSLSTMGS